MKWLNEIVGNILNALGVDVASRWGGCLQFFIYDVVKIMLLLTSLIFLISYIQSYFPPERTKRILGRFHGVGANCVAALLGTVTPSVLARPSPSLSVLPAPVCLWARPSLS